MRLTPAEYSARLADPTIAAQCDALERMLADRRVRKAAESLSPDVALVALTEGVNRALGLSLVPSVLGPLRGRIAASREVGEART